MSDDADVEASLRAVEPGWRFVKERALAQAHRFYLDRGRRVPPSVRLPLILSPADAEASGCFPQSLSTDAPATLVLVSSPADRELQHRLPDHQLLHYWRVLYALRVPTANAGAIWQSLPRVLQREVELVLKSTGLVPPDAMPRELAEAFGKDLLSCARFAPEQLRYRYPGMTNWPDICARLVEAFDEADLFRSTRPPGTAEVRPDPGVSSIKASENATISARDARRAESLARRAEAARKKGNLARSAILFAGAAEACSSGSTKYRSEGRTALKAGLVERLGSILRWNAGQKSLWRLALQALLTPATAGHWSPAAKALYDLQKIAVDLGGDLYAVDPEGWVTSFGRRPLLRKLSLARSALVHQRLRKVEQHLSKARLEPAEIAAIRSVFDPEIQRAEIALRAAMEPIILRAFQDAGLLPANFVERIALPKIVDELLDLTVAQGFFRFGDLRDALARNQLKMPDLTGPGQLFSGDALLRVDAELGEQLDGVYYPGEIYLRWFQRGSALAFGTKSGRWFTLYVALPFGAAFMTVEFAKYIAHEFAAVAGFVAGLFAPAAEAATQTHPHKSHGIAVTPQFVGFVIGLGILYLGLIHSTAMRHFAWKGLATVADAVRWVFAELPAQVWNSAILKSVRRNSAVSWFARRLTIPALGAGAAAVIGLSLEWSDTAYWTTVAGTFAALALALNTPPGQLVRERVEDALARLWRQIRVNFFPGLIGWIVWLFRELLGGLDRLIYSVDEWFRFREGQSKPSLAIKVALGTIWFPVRYVFRFAIYLLIEPQINPIKHFPVVTVSHKLLLPMIPALSTATGIGREWVAGALAGVPGIFGFLAWELKENWRLYAANRPDRLAPLALGHHGESVRGLLRPGFHSGTIPKAFAAIRRAIDKAEVNGEAARLRKPLDTLHHVEHAIRHFVERDLLAYLASTRDWAGVPLRCSEIHLGLQHIRVEIIGAGAPAELRLELIDSQVAGHCDDVAFLTPTTAGQRESWERVLLGFWAMGAVPVEDPRLVWREWVAFWEECKLTPSDPCPCTSFAPSAPGP